MICRRLIRDLKKSGTLCGFVRNSGGRSKYSKSELVEKNCMQTWGRRFLEDLRRGQGHWGREVTGHRKKKQTPYSMVL